jgi:hypothetical protein
MAAGSGVPAYAEMSGSSQLMPNGSIRRETFIGMAFAPSVRSVLLEADNGERIVRGTRIAGPDLVSEAGIAKWGYIALARRGDLCVRHIEARDEAGDTVINADTFECG